jgi:hydrogenase nickel incorporation protein HypB
VSSPGSGKTTLLCATIDALRRRAPGLPLAVIEGDQQTSNDADRIRATGAPAIQVNTGKGCHLDAPMVAEAFGAAAAACACATTTSRPARCTITTTTTTPPRPRSLLFIENVGNLVCPAMWDLGERAKVAILSVTEGEDKPLKYPDMFAAAKLMLLNKTDLLPHLDFDVAEVHRLRAPRQPGHRGAAGVGRSGVGMDAWLDWLLLTLPRSDLRSPPPQGGDASGLAEPDPRRPLDVCSTATTVDPS